MSNPFQLSCHICHETFYIHEFPIHAKTSHSELLCRFCGAPFSNKIFLYDHFKSTHTQCPNCPLKSNEISKLIDHITNVHDGEGLLPHPTFQMPLHFYQAPTPLASFNPSFLSLPSTIVSPLPSPTSSSASSISTPTQNDTSILSNPQPQTPTISTPLTLTSPPSQPHLAIPEQQAKVKIPPPPLSSFTGNTPSKPLGPLTNSPQSLNGSKLTTPNNSQSLNSSKLPSSTKSVTPPKLAQNEKPTGETEHTCVACGFKAQSQKGLSKHITLSHANDANLNPHVCPYCPQRRCTKASLYAHITKVHSKERRLAKKSKSVAFTASLAHDGEASYLDESDATKGAPDEKNENDSHSAEAEVFAEIVSGQKELDEVSLSDTSSINAILLGPHDVVTIKDHEVLDDDKLHFLVEMVDGHEKWEPLEFFQVEQEGTLAYVPSLLTYINEKNLKI